MITAESRDYSATVDIRLRVNGKLLDVSQVSEFYLILNEPAEAAPGTSAEVIITVDGRPSVRPIVLHDGIDRDTRRVTFF
jgi:hypothetical protein